MTQGDKVRSMTDEQLARFLNNFNANDISREWCLNLCPDRKEGDCDCPYMGYETALGWLKSEATK